MKYMLLAVLIAFSPVPAWAQMHHYTVGTLAPTSEQKPEAVPRPRESDSINEYGGGSFIVTPVQDCFGKLKPGEAVEIRKNFSNAYAECQARLKKRAEEKAALEKKKAETPPPPQKNNSR